MTKEQATKILDRWRQDFGGVEVVILHKSPDGLIEYGDRKSSIDFTVGRRGFAWLSPDDVALPHVLPLDRVKFEEAFDKMTIVTPSIDLWIQPLRTPEIVAAVAEWKQENPDRLDMTTTLKRLANEGTL